MGTLYYLRKENGEAFALNKAYHYMVDIPGHDWQTFVLPDNPEDFKRRYLAAIEPDWADRIVARLYRWARGATLHLTMDCAEEDDVPSEDEITGSPYDDDYDIDGNYIPGSAW